MTEVFSLTGPKATTHHGEIESQGWIAPAICVEVREHARFGSTRVRNSRQQDRYWLCHRERRSPVVKQMQHKDETNS